MLKLLKITTKHNKYFDLLFFVYICLETNPRPMAKETTPFLPPTKEEIMLIQPNNVTFGQYSISEWQENLLTLIADKIQQHITNDKDFPLDLFGQPYVEIICDEAGGKNNKAKVLQEAIDMTKKTFSFRWKHPKMNNEVQTSGVVITTVHNIIKTNRVTVNFNPWAIPFLLYYGVGVGGTRYNKSIALSLRGNYTKRIYKILCSQRDRVEYYYPMEQLRKDLEIPSVYSNSQIEQKIIKPSQARIKEVGSDVWFEYELICRFPQKGRKPKADTVVFHIQAEHPTKAGGEQFEVYSYVHRWMGWCFNTSSSKPLEVTEKLLKLGVLKLVYERAAYYDDQVGSGKMLRAKAENALKKMLRENYEIK